MQQTRRPALDGIRALAVLAVFASHAGIQQAVGGWVGVEVFFVLSGYLITTLLLQEREDVQRISLRRFYGRRALRLYPALLLLLVLGAPLYSRLGDGGSFVGYLRTAAFAGFYVEDFVYGHSGNAHGSFGHTWSLAIEEQFYLVWPLVLIVLARWGRRTVLAVALAAAVVSSVVTAVVTVPLAAVPNAYFLPYSQATVLFAGCALAAAAPQLHRVPPRALAAAGWLSGVGLTVLVIVQDGTWRSRHLTAGLAVSALLAVGLVAAVEAQPQGRLARTLSLPPLAGLGVVSYGFYLFHLPLLGLSPLWLPHLRHAVVVPVVLVATVALAVASYRLVERPIQKRWKHRVASPKLVDLPTQARPTAYDPQRA